jgi:predicted dehydrogenase
MSAQPDPRATAALLNPRSRLARGSSRPLRLGFLGLGWIGRKRLDAVAAASEVEIAALADLDSERLREATAAFPGSVQAADVAGLLQCDLDGVVIATPNACHAAQAVACLESGLAVFCQKPLAASAADTQRVLQAAQSANRLLGVDYCYRHVQGMHELRRRIMAGELGQVAAVDMHFHNAYAPNQAWARDRGLAGGGCLLDLGIHLIDLAMWLQDLTAMRLASSRLYAQGRVLARGEPALEDLAFAEFRQANGACVRLACSWNAPLGCDALIGMRIFGTRGGAHWCNVNGSFHDFELDVCRGTARERLGSFPDDWGARALSVWLERLRRDCSFDAGVLQIAPGAALIEEIYQA